MRLSVLLPSSRMRILMGPILRVSIAGDWDLLRTIAGIVGCCKISEGGK
jgi:hypothetical protein